MLRYSLLHRNYRAQIELDRVRPLLRGRAKYEKKIGLKKLFFMLRVQTKYRVELRRYKERALTRKNVDAALWEHNASWVTVRNDLARQNVALLPASQKRLALYEPLAFRAVVELCASRIPPPPAPDYKPIPPEAYIPRLRIRSSTLRPLRSSFASKSKKCCGESRP
jgi:hypothetical protein